MLIRMRNKRIKKIYKYILSINTNIALKSLSNILKTEKYLRQKDFFTD